MRLRAALAATGLALASPALADAPRVALPIPDRDLIGCTALTSALGDSGLLKGEDATRLALG